MGNARAANSFNAGNTANQTKLAGEQTAAQNQLGINQNALQSRQNNMTTAQQEGQNEYNRQWGNIGAVGSMVTGLVTSDERLKRFRMISSKLNNGKEDFKVYYKGKD